jgi:hypothetical protein
VGLRAIMEKRKTLAYAGNETIFLEHSTRSRLAVLAELSRRIEISGAFTFS